MYLVYLHGQWVSCVDIESSGQTSDVASQTELLAQTMVKEGRVAAVFTAGEDSSPQLQTSHGKGGARGEAVSKTGLHTHRTRQTSYPDHCLPTTAAVTPKA
ncbi:hypothetical protein RRG08_051926 [Elysia crispata]|uniref:Uncharacterized protein n=1 Tax=Elysia crispata TaxID=231223 RepID=A0AAE0Y2V9_9GAST|nr:hypothetical protein RRG08_051926 [Elysia crispata]